MFVLEANVDVVFAGADWYVNVRHNSGLFLFFHDVRFAGSIYLDVDVLCKPAYH